MSDRLRTTDHKVPLFSGMSDKVRRILAAESRVRTLPAMSIVFVEGTPATHLHVLLSGAVELHAKAGSREATINILHPGRAFILAAVVRNAVSLMSARTLVESRVLYLPAEAFREAVNMDAALAQNVSLELGMEFRVMVKHLRDHKLRSAKQRLAAYILRLYREQGGDGSCQLPATKRIVASLLGMEPGSLSRALASLQSSGVHIERDTIRVTDAARLEKLAASDWAIDDPQS